MNLPMNGKVVVIDDKYEEALPLVKALSSDNIPVLYYDGDDLMPSSPLIGVRVLFLDMRFGSIFGQRDIIAKLMVILEDTISVENGPYLLVIWSKHDNEDLAAFKEEISKVQNFAKPLIILDLEKREFFERETEVTGVDTIKSFVDECAATSTCERIKESDILTCFYSDISKLDSILPKRIKEDAYIRLKDILHVKLIDIGAFSLLFGWENVVNEAATRVVNNISDLFCESKDWNERMTDLLARMAISYSGKENLLNNNVINNEFVTKSTFLTMNEMLPDDLQTLIHEGSIENFNLDFSKDLPIAEKIIQDINYRLIVEGFNKDKYKILKKTDGTYSLLCRYKEKDDKICNLLVGVTEEEARLILVELMSEVKKVKGSINTKFLVNKSDFNYTQPGNIYSCDKLEEHKVILESLCLNNPVKITEIFQECEYIELEVSPSCDCAQKKWKMHRVVPGFIIPEMYQQYIRDNAAYCYMSPIFSLEGELKVLVFNFLYSTSKVLSCFDGREILLSIRTPMLVEIKNKLANHITRAGIISM